MKLKNLFASDHSSSPDEGEEFCCGKHAGCLKNKQARPGKTPSPIEYYDDEELDVFKNRPSNTYTEEEVKQFAEVLHTMSDSDISGWIESLRLRNIELPHPLKLITHNS